jgi:hypothetical protein
MSRAQWNALTCLIVSVVLTVSFLDEHNGLWAMICLASSVACYFMGRARCWRLRSTRRKDGW